MQDAIKNRLFYHHKQLEEKQRKKNTNSSLVDRYNEKPVLFNPGLGRISGSAIAGLFMSQILYWQERGWNKEWIYKTIKEIRQETCLTRSEQNRAIKIWKGLGILELERRGVPQRRHFRVDVEKLEQLLKVDYEKRVVETCK